MAAEKNGLDKAKIKMLEKLKEAGFDTANKIKMLDGREILKNNLVGEMENIFALQDAIKANHVELAWLMDGKDPRPSAVKKEAGNANDAGYAVRGGTENGMS